MLLVDPRLQVVGLLAQGDDLLVLVRGEFAAFALRLVGDRLHAGDGVLQFLLHAHVGISFGDELCFHFRRPRGQIGQVLDVGRFAFAWLWFVGFFVGGVLRPFLIHDLADHISELVAVELLH